MNQYGNEYGFNSPEETKEIAEDLIAQEIPFTDTSSHQTTNDSLEIKAMNGKRATIWVGNEDEQEHEDRLHQLSVWNESKKLMDTVLISDDGIAIVDRLKEYLKEQTKITQLEAIDLTTHLACAKEVYEDETNSHRIDNYFMVIVKVADDEIPYYFVQMKEGKFKGKYYAIMCNEDVICDSKEEVIKWLEDHG